MLILFKTPESYPDAIQFESMRKTGLLIEAKESVLLQFSFLMLFHERSQLDQESAGEFSRLILC